MAGSERTAQQLPAVPDAALIRAASHWQRVDFISDLHLQESEAATFEAWRLYLQSTPADAVFILGDLFEVWVGDDSAGVAHSFEAACADVLRSAARQRVIQVMRGNRDFLLGDAFLNGLGLQPLPDPSVLEFGGQRLLLSHGDALCLDDLPYMQFRAEVRSPAWQSAFLQRPLAQRVALARDLRAQSEARKRQLPAADWVDLDHAATRQWLQSHDCRILIHGHTHQPASHDLGDGLQRIVLSDWDANSQPPRLQVLSLTVQGLQRRLLS